MNRSCIVLYKKIWFDHNSNIFKEKFMFRTNSVEFKTFKPEES